MRGMLLISAMLAVAWWLLPPRGAEAFGMIFLIGMILWRLWRVSDAIEHKACDSGDGDSHSEILRESV